VAKKTRSKRKEYTKDDVKLSSLRQKARTLGIGLGHQR